MKNRWLYFVAILVAAILLRFWQLGSFPSGLTWDEAAIGYNAYGLITNHRDEWLNRTPISFKSFGDYKSPLGIYLTALPVALLGLNSLAVRLPVALASVGTVVLAYFLTKEILSASMAKFTQSQIETAALLSMALLAISPWSLHFSMIAFESNIAVFLVMLGTLGLFKLKKNAWWVVPAAFGFTLSLYAYHSAKIVTPLLILLFMVLSWKWVRQNIKLVGIFFALCLVLASPLLYVSIFGNASERLYSSTILTDENRKIRPPIEIAAKFTKGFVSHLDPRYLLLGKEINFRQTNGRDGILSPFEAILILIGLIALFKNGKFKSLRWFVIPAMISLIPGSLGVDVPHANRGLLGLFWWQLLAVAGFLAIMPTIERIKEGSRAKSLLALFIALIVGGSLAWHIRNDREVYATSGALYDLQYGYEEAINYVRKLEPNATKIYFSNDYGQAYIYLLFYKRMTPMEFHQGGLANYHISDNPWKDGAGVKGAIIVGSSSDFPEQVQGIQDILYPDGKLAFRIVRIE